MILIGQRSWVHHFLHSLPNALVGSHVWCDKPFSRNSNSKGPIPPKGSRSRKFFSCWLNTLASMIVPLVRYKVKKRSRFKFLHTHTHIYRYILLVGICIWIIIMPIFFFYLQVANSPSKLRFKANLSKRIISKQIAVRNLKS